MIQPQVFYYSNGKQMDKTLTAIILNKVFLTSSTRTRRVFFFFNTFHLKMYDKPCMCSGDKMQTDLRTIPIPMESVHSGCWNGNRTLTARRLVEAQTLKEKGHRYGRRHPSQTSAKQISFGSILPALDVTSLDPPVRFPELTSLMFPEP